MTLSGVNSQAGDQSDTLESRILVVASALQASLRAVLNELPDLPQRPQELARRLGLNRDIAGRVLSAVRAGDPVSGVHMIPGPEPLRRVLRAARKQRVPEPLIEAADRAVLQFQRLIEKDVGDRGALDAVVSAMVPEARSRFELASKQTIFKGVSQLKGAQADVYVHAAMIHPSSDPDRLDAVNAYGTLGLRRLRPGVVVKFTYHHFGRSGPQVWHTLDGKPPEQADGHELDQFCQRPPATLNSERLGEAVVYSLAGNDVGPHTAVDKLLCEVHRGAWKRHPDPTGVRRKAVYVAASIPTRLLVFDVLLHEDALPGAEPHLLLYDTAVEGMASVNDHSRDPDRLDLLESVEFLGRGTSRLHVNEAPTYADMVRHVAGRLEWDLDRFRAYRCRMQYPPHGIQVTLSFERPSGRAPV